MSFTVAGAAPASWLTLVWFVSVFCVCFWRKEKSCDAQTKLRETDGTGMPDHTRDSRRARQGKGKALQNLNGQGPCAAGIRKGCPEEQPPPQAAGASAISLRNA